MSGNGRSAYASVPANGRAARATGRKAPDDRRPTYAGAAATRRAASGEGQPGFAVAGAAPPEGVEIVRARYGPGHRHGWAELGTSVNWAAEDHGGVAAGMIWLDTETTGLAGGTGTYAFLIGLAYLDGDSLVTEQLLLRRLRSEAALLAALGERLAGRPHLVTFNGRRFDWPILESRFILSRQRPALPEAHTDLIGPARRLWHPVLGTHRLSVLEAEVIGAPRADDIPGWLIPGIYVDYLRTGDRPALDPVLAHNRADLLAMIALHGEVVRTLRDPENARARFDWEGAGVLLARRLEHARSAQCFERAVDGAHDPHDRWRALRRLARAYRLTGKEPKRQARFEGEAASWPAADRYRVHVLEEVAKIRARYGDRDGAERAACEAFELAVRLGLPSLSARLDHRLARLRGRAPQPAPAPLVRVREL